MIRMWSKMLVNTNVHMHVHIICIRVVNIHMYIRMYVCMLALHVQVNKPLSRFSPTDPGPSALNFSLNWVTSLEKSSTCCLVICTREMMLEQVVECEEQIVLQPQTVDHSPL